MGPPLAPLPQLQLCPVLRAPELGAGLPGGSQQSGAEGQNPLPGPAAHAAGDAAQGTVGRLGCERMIPDTYQMYQTDGSGKSKIPKEPSKMDGAAARFSVLPQECVLVLQ